MDSDKDQQALAWQQIIRNKAFDNVRVQRGESWVDAACRTLDELIDQKEQAEKSLNEEKSRSQFFAARADKANGERDAAVARAEQTEREVSTWRTSTESAHSDFLQAAHDRDEWKARATLAVFDVDVERTIRAEFVEEGMRIKTPVEYRVVRAVCELFGVKAEQSVDPVEAKAQELWEVAKPSANATWSGTSGLAKEQFRKVAAHVLGQEAER